MRYFTILALVAVMAIAVPAYGIAWDGPAVGSWHNTTNWAGDVLPGAGDNASISNNPTYGSTVQIYEGNAVCNRLYIGYYNVSSGHVELTADVTLTASDFVCVGNYTDQLLPIATFTQTNGKVIAPKVKIAWTDGDPIEYGYGKYTISGGSLNTSGEGIWNGCDDPADPTHEGLGIFRVEGDAATINTSAYSQNRPSRTECVLTAAGAVSVIGAGSYGSTLEGTILIDDTLYTGKTPGDTVTVLTASGAAQLDFTALKMDTGSSLGWVLISDDGSKASIQVQYYIPGDCASFPTTDNDVDDADLSVLLNNFGTATGMTWAHGDFNNNGGVADADLSILLANWDTVGAVPEPATLCLLGLGALGLLRRRRR